MSASIYYQNNPVKPIPFWLRLVPIFGSNLAFAAFKSIYLPRAIFERVATSKKTEYDESILIHESVHISRQKEKGVLLWTLKYLTNKSFRLSEELLAIKAQMLFLKSKNLEYDVDRKAKQFSNATYLWVMSEDKSKKILNELWQSLDQKSFSS